ncbi:MAG: integrase core domain-containing protein, partial [Actinomycetota bacterium]
LAAWRQDYNHVRPHSGLGGATPAEAASHAARQAGPGHAPGRPCSTNRRNGSKKQAGRAACL